MKILKYLLLLLFLFVIGLFVFISTQKNDYSIKVSRTIKTSQSTVFNYVNELKNWEDFVSWNEANDLGFISGQTTKNTGATVLWQGKTTGKATTLFVKESDSIAQKLILNDNESNISWKFIPNKKGIEVRLTSKGKLTLSEKFKSFFYGNSNAVLSDIFYKTLQNLDKNLDYEINTFTVKNHGLVAKPKTFFIGKSIKCDNVKTNSNIQILINEMVGFFDKNNIKSVGKPFVIYNSSTVSIDDISVCLPLKDSVHISPYSDVFDGKLETSTALKTTLTGSYLHLKAAKDSMYSYISKNKLSLDANAKPFDVYVKTKLDTKKASQWITEIYIPIVKKDTTIKNNSNTKPETESTRPNVETNTPKPATVLPNSEEVKTKQPKIVVTPRTIAPKPKPTDTKPVVKQPKIYNQEYEK